jgi:hypothetical protein
VNDLAERPMVAHELTCPECGAPMVLKPSRYKPFYGCTRWRETGCPGAHGAHPDGSPMGVPATLETRRARRRAHAAFDRLWEGRRMKRRDAYAWMQRAMGLAVDEAHIGRFTAEQCEQLIGLVDLAGPFLDKVR